MELDDSYTPERHSGVATNTVTVRTIGMDKPFFTALALVISIVSGVFCYFTETQEQRRVYYTMRCEGFVEQIAFQQKPTAPKYLQSICGPREK